MKGLPRWAVTLIALVPVLGVLGGAISWATDEVKKSKAVTRSITAIADAQEKTQARTAEALEKLTQAQEQTQEQVNTLEHCHKIKSLTGLPVAQCLEAAAPGETP